MQRRVWRVRVGRAQFCYLRAFRRAAERFADRATQNLLRAFAAGPAGLAHPAQDNLAKVKPPNIPALYDGVD